MSAPASRDTSAAGCLLVGLQLLCWVGIIGALVIAWVSGWLAGTLVTVAVVLCMLNAACAIARPDRTSAP